MKHLWWRFWVWPKGVSIDITASYGWSFTNWSNTVIYFREYPNGRRFQLVGFNIFWLED